MIKNSRWLLVAVAVCVLGALAWRARTPSGGEDGTLQGVVEFEERVLSFELAGRITRLPVRRGDVLEQDALIATLDDTLERAARSARVGEANAAIAAADLVEAGARAEDVRALAARVRAARAAEALVRQNLERDRALYERGALARALVDNLQSELERAVAERESLEQSLRALERGARAEEVRGAQGRRLAAESAVSVEDVRLHRHELRATHQGTLLDVHVEAGEVVGAGTPVATLADTRRPYVDVLVPVPELAAVRLGARARVRIDALSDALPGTVEHIARKTEFTPRYLFSERERPNLVVRVRIRVDDPKQRLYAGVPALVSLDGVSDS